MRCKEHYIQRIMKLNQKYQGLKKMNAKLVTENKSRKQMLDEAERDNDELLVENIELQAQSKQLQKFEEQHSDMHNEILKGRELNMEWGGGTWCVVEQGGPVLFTFFGILDVHP